MNIIGITGLAGSGKGEAAKVLVERFVAVALEHQVGGAPDIDLGYHAGKIAGLRSRGTNLTFGPLRREGNPRKPLG